MLDALMFEERGLPGIAVVTEPFRQTGSAMAAAWGLPGFRFLAVPHPIANLTDAALDALAARLAHDVTGLLSSAP